jgi:hypothetical protein
VLTNYFFRRRVDRYLFIYLFSKEVAGFVYRLFPIYAWLLRLWISNRMLTSRSSASISEGPKLLPLEETG